MITVKGLDSLSCQIIETMQLKQHYNLVFSLHKKFQRHLITKLLFTMSVAHELNKVMDSNIINTPNIWAKKHKHVAMYCYSVSLS